MKKHAAVSPINIFGNIYAMVMLLLCVPPIFWMFQFFFLVPNLMPYFIVTLAVPALGLGVGLYGLWITRNDHDDEVCQDTSKEMHE